MTAVREWGEDFAAVVRRIGPRFARSEARRHAADYLHGLLSHTERKNGWQLAEAVGDAAPYGIQQFLYRAAWDPDAVRDDRHLHAQVRADDENSLPRVEVRDAAAQERRLSVVRLIAKITLAQPVIDVVAAEVARDALQEVRLLERRTGAHERAQAARTAAFGRFLEQSGRRSKRVLPTRVRPLAAALDARLPQPVVAVDAIAAEAVAIRDPGFVDRLVLAGHDSAKTAAQDVRV